MQALRCFSAALVMCGASLLAGAQDTMPWAFNGQRVDEGSGTVTLTDTIAVPRRAKELRLFIPLVPEGIETTYGEVVIRYPIRKK